MKDTDKKRFYELMDAVAENFNATVSQTGIDLRFEALRAFDIQTIAIASIEIMKTRKYTTMPTIADFIENMQGGSAEDLAEVEARKVLEAVKKHGSYANIVFDNPVTMAVIHRGFGGWIKMCEEIKDEEHKWFLKDFIKTFGAFSRQNVTTYGILDGRVAGEPVLIGNPEKALQIAQAEKKDVLSIPSNSKGLPEMKSFDG
jgi:hypothetical protein